MSLMDELDNGGRDELRDAVTTAATAERRDHDKKDDGPDKNNHFELRFGDERSEEAYIYVERIDGPATGIEIMLWADKGWFTDDALEQDYPLPSDGAEPLGEFADDVCETVADRLDTDTSPSFNFHTHAPPSIVFAAQYYFD